MSSSLQNMNSFSLYYCIIMLVQISAALDYPSYQLPNVDFVDLVSLDTATAVRISNILTSDGALQINGTLA